MPFFSCSCQPSNFPIQFTKGDSYVIYATYTSNGTAIDLTNARVYMVAKTTHDAPDANAIFTISTVTGDIVVTNAAAGDFVVTIPSSATLGIRESLSPMVYNICVEVGPPYTSSLSLSGFSGLSGLGTYRATVFQGSLTLVPNVLDS